MRYFIENQLVDQKNVILELVNEGQYDKALMLLDFASGLWQQCGYGYKIKEIRQRVKDAYWHNAVVADHHQTQAKWERLYKSLSV